ncbi:RbsK Sugar kinases, ribokinase family [Candidatus Planktophila vernalis]|uniref:PfkB family carbohydrate kinase n=1 Tax=Candidatus Planktophila vernalis TaxID=1884907 RepID=UPI003CF25DC2
MSIWVCGEVLIDILPTGPVVGGGPANTAKALARLGYEVDFIDGISTDAYGVSARKELSRDGVGLGLSLTSNKPTCTATVTLDSQGSALYEFLIDGTATFDFNSSWLPDPERLKPSVLHIGTLVTIIEPGASVLFDWAVKVGEFAPIVFDPNIRPSVMADRAKYAAAVEKWVSISSIVKVSDDDIKWLYPDQSLDVVAHRWIEAGVSAVVITRGAKGLIGFTASGMEEVDGVKVDVVDTVGAGDTVGAIVVEGIIKHSVHGLQGQVLNALLHKAAIAAGITCSRAGAQPPRAHELVDAMEK